MKTSYRTDIRHQEHSGGRRGAQALMGSRKRGRSPDPKIEEVIALLREAGQEKKEELYQLLGDKYAHLKQAFEAVAESGRTALTSTAQNVQRRIRTAERKVQRTASEMERKIKEHPLPFLVGASVAAYLLGKLKIGKKRGQKRGRQMAGRAK